MPHFRSWHLQLILALVITGISSTYGCTPKNSARGVVERFIEEHYMAIDLKATEPLCTGLALDKIRKELELTAGQVIDESTRKPTIHYTLKQSREDTGHVTFLFKARVDVPDGGSFNKFWMISARRDGDIWKISNYSEYD